MMRHLGLSLLCLTSLLSPAWSEGVTTSEDVAALLSLSRNFEAASRSGDVDVLSRLTIPDAQWISATGGDPSKILADAKATSLPSADANGQAGDPLVAEREVQTHGDSAVITELVRVTGKPLGPPIRQSLFCVREGETWKVAHVHASPYLRWEPSIVAYEAADQQVSPPSGGIVFIGSSSVRRWETLASDFAGFPVLNRGFGGSQMIDSVLYAKRIVTPYSPAAVAIYEGDNDIGKGKDGERVLVDFKNFVASVHDELPETHIAFIAIKPSLKRWALWPEIRRANQLIKDFAASDSRIEYLDVATPMLGDDGMPREELFVSDGLHLSEQGYAVWTEAIRPWVESQHQRVSSQDHN